MKKNKIIIGSLVSLVVPATATSCSTGWTHWKKGNNTSSHTVFPHDKVEPIKYIVRSDEKLNKAWNETTNTINLNLLNNYFELYKLLGEKIKIFASNSIDSLWNKANWSKLSEFFNNIEPTFSVKLTVSGSTTPPIPLSLAYSINIIVDGLNSYSENIATTDVTKEINGTPILFKKGMDLAKAYDVEFNGLNSAGQPIDFSNVAAVGVSLLNQPIVKSLLDIDGTFALSMSKLVNIPQKSFDGIHGFFSRLLPFFNSLFSSTEIEEWSKSKGISSYIDIDGSTKFISHSQEDVASGQMIRYWLDTEIRK